MRKFLAPVAASLLAGALMLHSQAPDGATPAGKNGSDAVAANLVNTVCSSCHTLERVNNKKADSDAWTTTVTRMKEKGADLTDEQVPLVVHYLVSNAGTLTVTASNGAKGKGGGKGKGKGGAGFTPKNLKVLNALNLPSDMQSFVQGLGLLDKGTCSYCHVDDKSSDEKMQKVIARNMIIMMREINMAFADGKEHVTCYTCHRGSPTPATTP
ncbi:MAG: photosynthetic reaction center cytochrome c subunit [Bryobacterales bacterium]|nr:photosynthetic reaction center cytochrome c subunit [Bryobacterales bacterium]MBV9401160.1 photosynthetic reaction center cytochrome c subunit [Bryobacterales bacterium]